MGFYIRKSLKVGPFRVNLSKSGIGISAGIPGLRVGMGPRGNYVRVGRESIYFSKSLNVPRQQAPRPLVDPPSSPAKPPPDTAEPLQEIESGSVLEMIDASSAELLEEMNQKRKKVLLLPVAIAVFVLLLIGLLVGEAPAWTITLSILVSLGIFWVLSMYDPLRKTTVIFYELEPAVERAYERLHETFSELGSCDRTWHVEASGKVRDRKYHAGADSLVRRKVALWKTGAPPFVKTNIDVPLIPVGRQILAFMPDRLLVFDVAGVGAIGYSSLQLEVNGSKFIEDGPVPQDAMVVGKTWRYVNKNGGPDRRFKDNRELPVCLYEEFHLTSTSGLNEVVQVSRRGFGGGFQAALEAMGELQPMEADERQRGLRESRQAVR